MGGKDCNTCKRITISQEAVRDSSAGDLFVNGISGVPSGILNAFQRISRKLGEDGRLSILLDGVMDVRMPDSGSSFEMSYKGRPALRYMSGGNEKQLSIDGTDDIEFITAPHKMIGKFEDYFKKDVKLIQDSHDFRSEKASEGDGIVYIHQKAIVNGDVYFDTEYGDIVIDAGAVIGPFSVIEGPSYIGKFSHIDQAKIRRGSHIGHHCKISGEIEASLLSPYTNKHHEGFLGHAVVGRWVNLGAMTTNSDLKSNYSTVRMADKHGELFNTGEIKIGALIGDHVKTGIGTLIGTGARICMGAMLYGGGMFPGYIPPFSWTDGVSLKDYDLQKFLRSAEKVMARRDAALTREDVSILTNIYFRTADRREKVRHQWGI